MWRFLTSFARGSLMLPEGTLPARRRGPLRFAKLPYQPTEVASAPNSVPFQSPTVSMVHSARQYSPWQTETARQQKSNFRKATQQLATSNLAIPNIEVA